jgi:hypothetical protein
MQTFNLHIELGNEAMSEPHHVARVLIELADQLREEGFGDGLVKGGSIRDVNGNRVGNWQAK